MPSLDAVGKQLAESHAALLVLGVPKRGFTQRPRQAGEHELRGCLVIPHVRAVPEAASALIVAAFKSMELAIGCPEAGLRDQRGKVGHSRIAQGARQRTAPHGVRETFSPPLGFRKLARGVLGRSPCVGETRAVVIADDVVLVTFGRVPTRPLRRAVRKMPSQQECVVRVLAGRYLALQAQRASGCAFLRLRPQLAVFAEIVPEEHRAGPPFRRGPAAQMAHVAISRLQHA